MSKVIFCNIWHEKWDTSNWKYPYFQPENPYFQTENPYFQSENPYFQTENLYFQSEKSKWYAECWICPSLVKNPSLWWQGLILVDWLCPLDSQVVVTNLKPEPCVFGFLEPEPLEKKRGAGAAWKKKSGAGSGAGKN